MNANAMQCNVFAVELFSILTSVMNAFCLCEVIESYVVVANIN